MSFWLVLTVNSVTFGGLLFLLSAGFSLIFGLMRIPNLTHGSLFMVGAYVGATFVVVTHELASAYLIADRMVLINKGDIVAMGTVDEMRNSRHPKVRQFLDRVPEPAVAQELDYLQMLTEPSSRQGEGRQGKSR